MIKTTPPSRKHALSTPPIVAYTPPPAAPQTVLTMSADLERDSKGNGHLHATVRDHTGVQKTVDKDLSPKTKVYKSVSPKGKSHVNKVAAIPPTLAPGDAISGDEAVKKKEKRTGRAKEKEKENEEIAEEIEEGVREIVDNVLDKHDKNGKRRKAKEPVYRLLGGTGLPAPKSERESIDLCQAPGEI